MTLVVVGLSHTTAPVALRERVELDARRAAVLLTSLTERAEIDEAAALSTCNRTDVYLATSDPGGTERAALT